MALPSSMHLTLARRLGFGFASLLFMLLVVAGLSVAELRAQGNRVRDIVGVKNEKLALANGMLESINSLAIQARSVTLLTDVRAIDSEMKVLRDSQARYASGEKNLLDLIASTEASAEESALVAAIEDHPAD